MKRPHIIILNPDEMRADAVAHLGNPASCTPVLDRLQETEAVSFSNAASLQGFIPIQGDIAR